MSFLNELWEWVTTSRQQQDDLHINVILFAEQAWTESAQSWLPAHHVNKPVLLSSQSVDVVGFDVSALENLMAQKRAFFAGDDVSSIVRKNWFIGSVLLIFVIIFMALVALQYPQELKYFLATGDLPAAPIKQTSTVKAASTDEIDSDLEQTPVQAPNAEALSYESQLEVVNAAITDDLLVSNWPKDDAETATEPLPTPLPEIALEISPRGSEAADKQDFAVPDIVSVQQLDDQLEQTIASDAEAETEETVSQINSDSRADTSYLFDEALLLSLPQNQVLLQLSGIQNRTVLAAYLRDNDLEEVTWIYQTERYGGPWYVVLLNQPFASAAAATAAVANLPAKVQQDGPFAKRIAQIQQEIKP
jgi:DamX protein